MERVTKAEVRAVFERLCKTYEVPVGGKFDMASKTMSPGWALDYNGVYGGWIVVGYDGKGTGEQANPLGCRRMPSRQFVQAMHLAINAHLSAGDFAS